ncbi:MAG TPA: hypothetical protein VNZ05_07850 [Solirubrobacteraceae bacterium]|jgi:hypothetical protein|nr:hypothetical protein [Solirubrobacteraceae bacterium]
MLTAAERFTFPDGSEYAVISSPANPEREPLVMEMVYQPRCLAPPPHVRPNALSAPMAILAALGRVMRLRLPS